MVGRFQVGAGCGPSIIVPHVRDSELSRIGCRAADTQLTCNSFTLTIEHAYEISSGIIQLTEA